MKLRHIALRGLTRYTHAESIQEQLVRQFLAAKADPSLRPPPPTVLTAQFHPVYTLGRREQGSLTPSLITQLSRNGGAEVHQALRGGQTTYHGPGQLTAYPILDLRSHGLGTRSYMRLLEESVMGVCGTYGVATRRTENTGVWVDEERKIAAVGVRLRRFVASHGVAINVGSEVEDWFKSIVACGLVGKGVASLEGEGVEGVSVEGVAGRFVGELARSLEEVEGVEVVEAEAESVHEGRAGLLEGL